MSVGEDVVRARWMSGDLNEPALDNRAAHLVWETLVEYLEITQLANDVFTELDHPPSVITAMGPAAPTASRFDAERVLASKDALAALDLIGGLLRDSGYQSRTHPDADAGVLASFARGRSVTSDGLASEIGQRSIDALVGVDAAVINGGQIVPTFSIIAVGRLLVLVPPQYPPDDDLVYFGPDSLLLLQHVWLVARGGRLAIDLGTGTGYLAAALASRYELTIGTDLRPATAAAAALTFRLNARFGGPLAACVADLGRGLNTGCADLVIANAPWRPSGELDDLVNRRIWADGGPFGLEAPRRFIVEGASLLAPGGVAITQCLDVRFGRNGPAGDPQPLVTLAGELQDKGFTVVIHSPGHSDEPIDLTRHFYRETRASEITLVNVVVERPAGHLKISPFS